MLGGTEKVFDFWNNCFNNLFPKPTPKEKITHFNARFKVTKTTEIKEVFYSNKETVEEARAEAWTAFSINQGVAHKTRTVPDFVVEDNPHKSVDDDGFDTVTGIQILT